MLPQFKFALRKGLEEHKEFLPTRGEPKASGWDVRATDDYLVGPFEYVKIKLGFRALCPDGWWFELRPRSSTFAKKSLHALYGVVDETYEGEVIFACQYIPYVSFRTDTIFNPGPEIAYGTFIDAPDLEIKFGDAIGQIIPIERREMVVIEATNAELDAEFADRNAIRGAGGFGSTTK